MPPINAPLMLSSRLRRISMRRSSSFGSYVTVVLPTECPMSQRLDVEVVPQRGTTAPGRFA
jgi:hypothetical protein